VVGGFLVWGTHALGRWCRGQAVASFSFGDADFYGAVTAVAETLALSSLVRDWNLRYAFTLHVNTEACMGAISRRGLGGAKHINMVFLWIYEKD
jgi:hypothetical protein